MLKIEKQNEAWYVTNGRESIRLPDEIVPAFRKMSPAQVVGELLRNTCLPVQERQIVESWRRRMSPE